MLLNDYAWRRNVGNAGVLEEFVEENLVAPNLLGDGESGLFVWGACNERLQ